MASTDKSTSASKTTIDVNSALKTTTDGVASVVDSILYNTGHGPISTAVGDTFHGINHRGTVNPLPINREGYGLTFFTRPDMNFTTDNLDSLRILKPFMTSQKNSLNTIIRCYLDNRLASADGRKGNITTPFVDQQCAFIPLLTNTLISMNGWPDVEVQSYTSTPGNRRESVSFTDDTAEINGAYDLQATFRNVVGDPITTMMLAWIYYQAAVFEGIMMPYMDNWIEHRIDYQTRIWRITLDPSKTRVQKIGACFAAYPTAISIGAAFNFESDRVYNDGNDQISVRFRAIGAEYMSEILIKEFNDVVQLFNGSMTDNYRSSKMHQLTQSEVVLFNHRGYPRIDPDTYEMQWWVSKSDYSAIMGGGSIKSTTSGTLFSKG
jgi:hypothetical protein